MAQPNQIKVATESWPPFRIHDEEGLQGIDFYVWEEIAKELNLDIKYTKYPWARILKNLKSGDVDVMSGLAKSKSRAEYIYYTTPAYYTCSFAFYIKKGNKNLIRKYEDLYNYSIGYVRNSVYFKRFDKDTKLHKHPVTAEIQLIEMLKRDRLDIIIGNDCQVDYEIKELGLQDIFEKTQFKPQYKSELYFVISKKSPFVKDIKRINKVIQRLVNEGKIKAYAKKYYE